jgi:hypothetical protein
MMIYGIAFELYMFITNIKKECCGILEWFIFSKYEERTPHNMLCLMLDLRFKNLCLKYIFIGHEKNVNIVGEYDK